MYRPFFPSIKIDRAAWVRRFGDTWPFVVDAGVLQLRGKSIVFIVAHGKTYAVNGKAKTDKHFILDQPRYESLDDIWADDPKMPGCKTNIGPLITLANGLK